MNGQYRYLLLTLLLLLLSPPIAQASINVKPRKISFPAPAEEPYSDSFRIENEGKIRESVIVRTSDWTMDKYGRVSFRSPGSLDRSLNPKLSFSPARLEIPPGETRKVNFQIGPTSGEESRWGVFLIRSIRERGRQKEGVNIGVKVQHAVTLYQKGAKRKKEGEITAVSVKKGEGKISFLVRFENNCESFLRPKGRVEIKDMEGNSVEKVKIKRHVILPHHERILVAEVEKSALGKGKYLALVIMDFGGDHLVGAQRKFRAGF